VIAKLHAKKPEDRFQSAREVADVFADWEAQLLNDVRQALSGGPSFDPAEVKQDVHDPIDPTLAGRATPVEASSVEDLRQKLGSRAQWLPEGEPACFRRSPSEWPAHFMRAVLRVGRRIAGVPVGYWLAFLSLSLLIAAYMAIFLPWRGTTVWLLQMQDKIEQVVQGQVVVMLVSFILARAALSLFGTGRLTGGQKWLLYPALVNVYLPVTVVILLGPVALCGLVAIKTVHQFNREREDLESDRAHSDNWIEKDANELRQAETLGKPTSRRVDEIKKDLAKRVSRRETIVKELENYPPQPILGNTALTPVVMTYGLIAVAGATWFLVGLFCTLFSGVVRNVFRPFADGFSRQMGFGLAVLGLLMSLGGLVVFR
jgi:hypothetical protein